MTVKPSCRPFAFTLHNAFLNNKKRFGNNHPASFFAWFLKWNISFVIFYQLTKFHCLTVFNLGDIEQSCIVIVCQPGCDIFNFKINLIFLIKPFFKHLEKKRAFKMKQKTFFIIFEGLSLKQIIKHFFWKVRIQLWYIIPRYCI